MENKLSRFVKSCLCLVAMAILAGCIVQSLNKFYTNESKTPLPAICGDWQPVEKNAKEAKDNEKDKLPPWKFTEDNIVTYDEDKVASNIITVYFKVGENIFVDCSPRELDKEKNKCVNGYWLSCIRQVHTLCKVELGGEELKLIPINPDKLAEMVENKECELKSVEQAGSGSTNDLLYVSGPAEWLKFLEKFGADKELFKSNNALVFKKLK